LIAPGLDTEAPAVSVLVVDDQEPFRAAARFVVCATTGYEVVGEVETGEDALELAERLQPALVLMDINLPGISGIEATRRLKRVQPDTIVLLLSTYSAADLPDAAGTCGARAYVHKTELTPDVLTAVVNGTQPPGFG
jgi:two-component system, NarL family, invasion response regulator UvrY